jgi:5-methylcytosine-specific restriction endonuclease McrA
MSINEAIRQAVRERAQYLCEYCHSSEEVSAAQFAVDHILPRCNSYRYNFTTALDPHTQNMVPLFNPRTQRWAEHFVWTADGLSIVGTTPIGRATCNRLDMNDARHNDGAIVKARRLWLQGGWHPPADDPRQNLA